MNYPTKDKPKITFVKRAGMWVQTYFEEANQGKSLKQVQVWTIDCPKKPL